VNLYPEMNTNLFRTKRPHFTALTLCLAVSVALVASTGPATAQPADARPGDGSISHRPRIIVTTDLGADPDDDQSLVRLLVCANEFDIEGLIVSTGCWKKNQSNTDMLDRIVDAYGEVLPNLQRHAKGFPSYEYLKSISVLGQTGYGMSDVGDGKDSEGSDLIIASVDKEDPRPVWVQFWGGGNNLAQAIWKVRNTRSEEELAKFLSASCACSTFLARTMLAHGWPRTFLTFSTSVPRVSMVGSLRRMVLINVRTFKAMARWELYTQIRNGPRKGIHRPSCTSIPTA
jgi:hypothetical protein